MKISCGGNNVLFFSFLRIVFSNQSCKISWICWKRHLIHGISERNTKTKQKNHIEMVTSANVSVVWSYRCCFCCCWANHHRLKYATREAFHRIKHVNIISERERKKKKMFLNEVENLSTALRNRHIRIPLRYVYLSLLSKERQKATASMRIQCFSICFFLCQFHCSMVFPSISTFTNLTIHTEHIGKKFLIFIFAY